MDNSETDVHVQQLDPATFSAVGTATTVKGGKEAGGLVAQNDGFALLTNEVIPSGTANAPPGNTPVPVVYRYTNGAQTWKTFLGGPGVHEADGLSMSPDLNGDLVYSEAAKMYGAYFVVTNYAGYATGHFGDSVEYVNDAGQLQTIKGASSSWGCSHNTGIAFEAADQPPFAGLCAEDHGAIWLNTKTQGMDGVKVSNENATNGASGEAMGGMSGSYSQLARFTGNNSYIFSWVSRGATNLVQDSWRGKGYTAAQNRTNNRNVAIALMSDKNTLVGPPASSTIGAASGDDQVNWITKGTADCSNAHVAAFDDTNALVTWEEIANPSCDFIAMGCRGAFTGSKFQQVDSTGVKVGEVLNANDVYVAGDMVTMPNGQICWPYPNVTWSLDKASRGGGRGGGGAAPAAIGPVRKMSFACMSVDGAGGGAAPVPSSTAAGASSSAAPASSSAAPAPSTSAEMSILPISSFSTPAPAIPTQPNPSDADTEPVFSIQTVPNPPEATATAAGVMADGEPAAIAPVPHCTKNHKRFHRRQATMAA